VFGPGFGEAVLVHVGQGDWLAVDSCVAPGDETPYSLTYLERIGVEPEEHVKLIVASHWDDDHIRGLCTLIRRCRKSRFSLSSAYTTKDFLSILRAYEPGSMVRRSGVREFWDIYEYLLREKKKPRHAVVDRMLWRRKDDLPCTVTALSPSDSDEAATLEDFRRAFDEAVSYETREFFSTVKPNASSVVIWIAVGEVRILLGADLETEADPSRGWTAVLAADAWAGEQASVFKIPHHGSASSYEPAVWGRMLVSEALAPTSPFVYGRHKIPSVAERQAVRSHTTRGYLTRDPNDSGSPLRGISAQTLAEATRAYQVMDVGVGHVRGRGKINDPSAWTIDLFHGATTM